MTTLKKLCYLSIMSITATSYSSTTNVKAVLGNITEQTTDIIVNAANPQLAQGSGVCGAIFTAAGAKQLQAACNKYPSVKGIRCPVGQSRMTDSFNLSKIGVKKIIHAVGPDARIIKDPKDQKTLLKSAYTTSLQLATENKFTSISFPFISSGVYAVDHTLAAQAAIDAVYDFIEDTKTTLKEIAFVLYYEDDYNLFESLLTS